MAFEVLGNGVLWRGDGETVRIEAWGRGIRVRAAVMACAGWSPPLAVG